MGVMMFKNMLLTAGVFFATALLVSCAGTAKKTETLDFDEPATKTTVTPSRVEKKKVTKTETATTLKTAKAAGIVVDAQDEKTLERMNVAVEAYVLKHQVKDFTKLCQDSRFDCFVEEKVFPKGKKKLARSVPPYASGSKMGLQGEVRVQVRYEFFP